MLTIEKLNAIIDNDKCDLLKCVTNPDMYATFTVREMVITIPKIKKMSESKNLGEFLEAAGYTEEAFAEEFPLTPEEIERMKKYITQAEIRVFALAVVQKSLAENRYHTCQSCGADFYTTEADVDVCAHCAKYYGLK